MNNWSVSQTALKVLLWSACHNSFIELGQKVAKPLRRPKKPSLGITSILSNASQHGKLFGRKRGWLPNSPMMCRQRSCLAGCSSMFAAFREDESFTEVAALRNPELEFEDSCFPGWCIRKRSIRPEYHRPSANSGSSKLLLSISQLQGPLWSTSLYAQLNPATVGTWKSRRSKDQFRELVRISYDGIRSTELHSQ